MPVVFVTTHPLTMQRRAQFAQKLTEKIAHFAETAPENVQIFFTERTPGPDWVEVHAVAHGPSKIGWDAAVRQAIGHTYEIRISLYDPGHTARGGVLREPHRRAEAARPVEPESAGH